MSDLPNTYRRLHRRIVSSKIEAARIVTVIAARWVLPLGLAPGASRL